MRTIERRSISLGASSPPPADVTSVSPKPGAPVVVPPWLTVPGAIIAEDCTRRSRRNLPQSRWGPVAEPASPRSWARPRTAWTGGQVISCIEGPAAPWSVSAARARSKSARALPSLDQSKMGPCVAEAALCFARRMSAAKLRARRAGPCPSLAKIHRLFTDGSSPIMKAVHARCPRWRIPCFTRQRRPTRAMTRSTVDAHRGGDYNPQWITRMGSPPRRPRPLGSTPAPPPGEGTGPRHIRRGALSDRGRGRGRHRAPRAPLPSSPRPACRS